MSEHVAPPPRLGRHWYVVPLLVFAGIMLAGGIMLMILAKDQVPMQTQASPAGTYGIANPSYFEAIQNWDGQWFRRVAEHGYATRLPMENGRVVQNAWPFFPLYPGVVSVIMHLTGASFGLAASLVSLSCGAVACCLLYRLLHEAAGPAAATLGVAGMCSYPTAITLQFAYAEAMTLLLLVSALWALRARRYLLLTLAAVALSLTRPIALPLAGLISLVWLVRWRREPSKFPVRERMALGAAAVIATLSFGLWPGIAAVVTGTPSAFFQSEQAWMGDPSQGWPSWLLEVLSGASLARTFIVSTLLAGLIVLLTRPSGRFYGRELRLWSGVYPLYLVAATRPTSSILRYAMLAIGPWWPFPQIDQSRLSRGAVVALPLIVATVGLFMQYWWLRWFYVLKPEGLFYP